ncbi:MAG: membrane protein insertase YidC [Burkholderiaceae bacterium]|nr:membrane protein insertase YidC [Burkholderiaceae bacterium]
MDTRRAILWVIFSMSLLLLWDAYMKHSGRGSMFGAPVSSSQTQEKSAGAGQASAPTVSAGVPVANPAPKADSGAIPTAGKAATPTVVGPASANSQAASASERFILKNKEVELEIDAQGARIVRTVLLDQSSEAYEGKRVVLFDRGASRRFEAQSGLVGQSAAQVAFPNHTSVFKKAPIREDLDPNRHVALVSESGGVKLTKIFSLEEKGNVVRVSHTVQNTGADALSPTVYLQLMRNGERPPGESQFYQTFMGPAIYTNEGKFQKIDFSDIEKNKASHVKAASDGWFGIIQHYFVSAWIPKNDAPREFYTRRIENNLYSVGLMQALPAIAPGAQQTHEAVLYAGPQVQDVLEKLAPGLDLVVDYGWLTFLAKPIYWLLEQLYRVVANWGWAIVLLTVIIKAAFYPLSAASYKSMAKMKAVTPRLMKLRETYANDKAKLNQAMMELYKTEKINPLGGCLPILIQIPVFIALYWVLLASVEMRNAPWLGWITDLSAPDPYYILPVIMAITMFIQTKLNPPPPDPIQAKVMMFMPLVFSVFFFFFPAGLVLYWLVNNVLSIAQQWSVTRQIEKAAAAHR